MINIDNVVMEAVEWLKKTAGEAGAKGIVLGLSGGIDSAVVAALAKRAFPDNTLGIIMPCHSNPEDVEHARLVAEALNLETKTVVLDDAFDTMKRLVDAKESDPKLAIANMKPRLRMITLYYHAGVHGYIVAGTGNRSEITIGYSTKYGDGGVDIQPIGSFVKSEVRELAAYLGIPEIIITKAPTAGLWENQTDENEMGMTYAELDNYILTGNARDYIKEKVDKMNERSEHKRRTPLVFVPSQKA